MPSITFRGQDVPLITGVDDLDLDSAEVLEAEIGIDLRDFNSLPKVRMFKVLTLISAQAAGFTDATLAEVGRLKLSVLLEAFATAEPAAGPPAVDVPDAPVVAEPDEAEVLSPTNAGSDASPTLPAA